MAGNVMNQRDGWIWYDGEMVPWQDAKLHVLTHGLHYASSVFEGQRAYGGEIFKLHEHSQRLIDSARMLDFELGYSVNELDEISRQVLAKNNLKDAYMRPFAWRGSEEMGIPARGNKVHVAVALWPLSSYFSVEDRIKGLTLTMADWRRPDPRTIPCHAKAAGLYMICTLSKHAAIDKGFGDALMLDYRGLVAEATAANIFFHRNGELHTPTPDCFLNGITRRTVIDLAKTHGLKVIERAIKPEELGDFDECFLTGTAAEVTPVSAIDDQTYVPGEVCRAMVNAYTEEVQPKSVAAE